ncbi:plasmid SOS inhibition protein A [Klebsiella variicola]|uniref:plasmid SOS inhibition protein A n=1 Tax=Klebsiella variicola TaxID=244366 RepID=UPI00218171F2|nr:hypothetical protein NUKP99_45610 [Klebsiella variicola]
MTQTTELIMTENTVSQTYRATYSPDDNKLRLYTSLRLDEETYSLINKAGFRWAPKQELFVAPPETVCTWYTRWSDEFDAAELAAPFWRWQSRFASLKELDWLRISGEPLYAVMYEIPFIVRETPEHIRVAERWQVPNMLADRSGV